MRASYRRGIEWIALNDEPDWYEGTFAGTVRGVAKFLSVALVADLFGKETEEVARAVVRYRIRNGLVA